jgi:hypothetical protein
MRNLAQSGHPNSSAFFVGKLYLLVLSVISDVERMQHLQHCTRQHVNRYALVSASRSKPSRTWRSCTTSNMTGWWDETSWDSPGRQNTGLYLVTFTRKWFLSCDKNRNISNCKKWYVVGSSNVIWSNVILFKTPVTLFGLTLFGLTSFGLTLFCLTLFRLTAF